MDRVPSVEPVSNTITSGKGVQESSVFFNVAAEFLVKMVIVIMQNTIA